MKASILQYFLPPPNLITPRPIECRPPCVPRRSHVLSHPSPIASALIWLVVVCGCRLAAASSNNKFRCIYFLSEIRWPKRCDGVLPYRHSCARRLSVINPNDAAAFWLVVALSHPAEAIEI